MYYDEDGDLAHEFYEETIVTKNGRKRAKLKRIHKNLIPQVVWGGRGARAGALLWPRLCSSSCTWACSLCSPASCREGEGLLLPCSVCLRAVCVLAHPRVA